MKETQPAEELILNRMPWSRSEKPDPVLLLIREWLVTNGLGGYASCSVSGACHGFAITDFRSHDNIKLIMDVRGGQLFGYDPSGESVNLVDARITLTGYGMLDNIWTLTIRSINDNYDFWAPCDSIVNECKTAPPKAYLYQFDITDNEGECVELCNPQMSSLYHTLAGSAVIFKGDIYDYEDVFGTTSQFKVRSVDGTTPEDSIVLTNGPNYEGDLFNIACVGTTISKLHLLRHTSASMGPGYKTTVAQRQTMMRLLVGDYCGVGHSFTRDGQPLGIDFKIPYMQELQTPVGLGSTGSVDAMWGPTGASCIDTPRLAGQQPDIIDKITNKCAKFDKPTPPCGMHLPFDGNFGANYAISANPPPIVP